MSLFQILVIGVAAALVVFPSFRVIASFVARKVASLATAELRKAFPALTDAVVDVAPALVDAGARDMRTVLDLAAKLRDQGQTEAVKLCQQLLDQMLKPKA